MTLVMMATGGDSEIPVRSKQNVTIYDCPICLEEFKIPKYLPCLHTFCEICLQTYVKSTAKVISKTNSTFSCPVCRMVVKGENIESLATELPFNHIIFSLMTDERSKNKVTYNCDPCGRVGKDVNATNWCQHCNELLCEDCVENFHKRLKNSDQHNLVSLLEGQDIPLQIAESKIDEPCSEHKGKTVEIYCLDHCQMCCVICLTKNHRECKNIKTFDEVVQQFENGKHEKNQVKGLKFINKEMMHLVSKRQNEIARLKKEEEVLTLKSWNQIDHAMTRLQQMKLQLKTDISAVFASEIKPLEIETETLIGFNQNIQQSIKFLTTVEKYGSSMQNLLSLQKIHDCLNIQRGQFDTTVKDETMIAVFEVDLHPSVLAFIRNTEPVFKITKNHSKSRWKDTSKTEILKKMAELKERFVKMVNNEDSVEKDEHIIEQEDISCSTYDIPSEMATSRDDDYKMKDTYLSDEDNAIEYSEEEDLGMSGYSRNETFIHLKPKTKKSQRQTKQGKREKRRFHTKYNN